MNALKYFWLFSTLSFAYAIDSTGSEVKLLMSLISGHYSNDQDLVDLAESGIRTGQSSANVYIRALRIPTLQSEPVMYFEKYVGDVLYLQLILQFAEKGDIIIIRQNNFTHPENFIPGTFDISKLESLTKDALTSSPECDVFVRRVDDTVFQIRWPDCTRANGFLGEYSITVTCRGVTYVSPKHTFVEAASKIPYVSPQVERYPIPDSVFSGYEDYISFCEK